MNTLRVHRGHAQVTYDVELTPAEAALPDRALIDLADAGGDAERAKTIYNFGGVVERSRRHAGLATITVYID